MTMVQIRLEIHIFSPPSSFLPPPVWMCVYLHAAPIPLWNELLYDKLLILKCTNLRNGFFSQRYLVKHNWYVHTFAFLLSRLALFDSFILYPYTRNSSPNHARPQIFLNCFSFSPHSQLLGIWRLIHRFQHLVELSTDLFCLFSGSFSCLSTLYTLNLSSHQDEQAKESSTEGVSIDF